MTNYRSWTAVLLLSILCPHTACADDGSLQEFLSGYCIECHSGSSAEGNLSFDLITKSGGEPSEAFAVATMQVLSEKSMPPEDELQPSSRERSIMVGTLRRLIAKHRAEQARKSVYPGLGNLVNHEQLFTAPNVRRAATPTRIWRRSPHIFLHQANRISASPFLVPKENQGGDGLHPAFAYMTPAHTFRDHADVHVLEQATTELLFDASWQIAGIQVSMKYGSPATKEFLQLDRPTRSDWDTMIQRQFHLVLGREPTEAERGGLLRLATDTVATSGVEASLKAMFAAVLLKPEAVYRYEIGAGKPDRFGRVLLSEEELQFAISYALTDNAPDAVLTRLADSGKLRDRRIVEREVERILDDPEASGDRLIRFFREYFEYDRAPEVFKNARPAKLILGAQRVQDADDFVQWILQEDRNVLARLLTEDKLFMSREGLPKREQTLERMRRMVFEDYGFPPDWEWTDQQPVAPPIGRRSGMLTHPAWLHAFSDNEKNQAIQRGRWIQMKLLGGVIPDTPIGVDAKLPTDEDLTLREKMASVTKATYCWTCHSRMDPLGLPLEQFDDFGRYRKTELKRPVVKTGTIAIGDPEIDGPVNDPFEMVAKLAKSNRVEQVFIRHAFRYFMGRNEAIDDAPTLIDAQQAYQRSGGSMKALVKSLLTSDSFLYRQTQIHTSASKAVKLP